MEVLEAPRKCKIKGVGRSQVNDEIVNIIVIYNRIKDNCKPVNARKSPLYPSS